MTEQQADSVAPAWRDIWAERLAYQSDNGRLTLTPEQLDTLRSACVQEILWGERKAAKETALGRQLTREEKEALVIEVRQAAQMPGPGPGSAIDVSGAWWDGLGQGIKETVSERVQQGGALFGGLNDTLRLALYAGIALGAAYLAFQIIGRPLSQAVKKGA